VIRLTGDLLAFFSHLNGNEGKERKNDPSSEDVGEVRHSI